MAITKDGGLASTLHPDIASPHEVMLVENNPRNRLFFQFLFLVIGDRAKDRDPLDHWMVAIGIEWSLSI